jgi:hypothetical protein
MTTHPSPKLTPINLAEAILEPFWDPQLSGLDQWTITPGAAHGLNVTQNWCWVSFEWARPPKGVPALRMERAFDLDLSAPTGAYDHLLVSIVAPQGARLSIKALTEKGWMRHECAPAEGNKREEALDLAGSRRLLAVRLELFSEAPGVQTGWLNWVGVQNSASLPGVLNQRAYLDKRWDGYLQPPEFEPSFRPSLGLLFNMQELELLRGRYADLLAKPEEAPLLQGALRARREAELLSPERRIGEFVNFWGDTRYCRARDHDKILLGENLGGSGVQAAAAGLLLKDKELLRLAARHALSIAFCEHWDDGMICRFPGSTWEHRCFVQSLCTFETSLVLDLAGELFTDLGKEFLLRRIAEEGLGSIRYNTWKHEYIYHNNQLAWFTPGRMAGALVLEKTYARAAVETEQAFQDLAESLEYAILPDGGYVEGPTYFTTVAHYGGLALYLYARSRGKDFNGVLPAAMRRTAGFAALVASTTPDIDVIPVCDAGDELGQDTLSVMSTILPGSAWSAMYQKSLRRTGGMPDSLLALALDARSPSDQVDFAGTPYEFPSFHFLPDLGWMASQRILDGATVKLLIPGNSPGAGHTHEDKGSFVLEFAGETFAMDPGTCDYSHPLADEFHNCERHNMLVPYGLQQRPAPLCPLPEAVKPTGSGDAVSFKAQIDAAPGWEPYYARWLRTWNSPEPGTLTIQDEYELKQGEGVEFYWSTRLAVRIDGSEAMIRGERGQVNLSFPAGCSLRLDELPMFSGGPQRRIALRVAGKSGVLSVRATLSTF